MPVNIGNPREMTIREFGDAVLKATGSGSKFIEKPLPVDDPKVRRPDISKAQAVLGGWEPKVQLEEGLRRTTEYFQRKLAEKGEAALR
jgi:dTDP-glucose 4,6-dehydratase